MSDVKSEQQSNESPEQKSGKVKVNFDNVVKKISALLGKELPKSGRRTIPKGDVQTLVHDLFKEENEEMIKTAKEELKQLLKDYTTMWKEIENKKKELETLSEKKMKEFTDAGQKVLAKFDGIPEMEKSYSDAFKAINGDDKSVG